MDVIPKPHGFHPRGSPQWFDWKFKKVAHEIQKLLIKKTQLDASDQENTRIDQFIENLKDDYAQQVMSQRELDP